ncbi:MAG: beta-lactamase family protein [Verrucomicrobia bacterium]|nr:beta-lactamase family protein [Verrucomicrobiota bacterium]
MGNIIYLLIVFVMHFASVLNAEPPKLKSLDITNPRDVSNLVESRRREYNVPGMVAAMIHNNKIEAAGAAGVRIKGRSEGITLDDKIHLGSCTKAMTATLWGMVVEKKLAHWDTKYYEQFDPSQLSLHPAYYHMSYRQLLNHRAGLAKDSTDLGLPDYRQFQSMAGGNSDEARAMTGNRAFKLPPSVTPGSYNYSNMSYIFAGHFLKLYLENPKDKDTWQESMKKYLFAPLGMSSAGFGPPPSRNSQGQIINAEGHSYYDGQPVGSGYYADNAPMMGPAGTVHCSILDWAKFVNIHLQGAQGKNNLLLAETYKELHTPILDGTNAYAMGWWISNYDGVQGPVLMHNGTNTAWYALVAIFPAYDLAIVVGCNELGHDWSTGYPAAGALLWDLFRNHMAQVNRLHEIGPDFAPNIESGLPERPW